MLSPAERDGLERRLAEREGGTSTQVVVAIFRSLQGESLESFSIRLAQAWRIGRKGLDNGVVFLVFLDERKMRVEVGYGLEATLTDAVAASIIRDVVAPRLMEGQLAAGIAAGLDAITAAIAGTYEAPRWVVGRGRGGHGLALVGLALIALTAVPLLVMSLVQARQARRSGWTGTGSARGYADGHSLGGRGGWGGGLPMGGGGGRGGGFGGGGVSFGGGGASGGW